mgnify:CR=1 FL=1
MTVPEAGTNTLRGRGRHPPSTQKRAAVTRRALARRLNTMTHLLARWRWCETTLRTPARASIQNIYIYALYIRSLSYFAACSRARLPPKNRETKVLKTVR